MKRILHDCWILAEYGIMPCHIKVNKYFRHGTKVKFRKESSYQVGSCTVF